MSKRAEEMATKAYPVVIEEHTERDLNKPRRLSYIKGYEQAEKDTIERAVNVLINLPSLVIPSNYIAYFSKQMMEEE